MLAVGSRVGTLFAQSITQSIYTVSGPFHPFGGAVDIIVVEQEDGTFKSSPWYVKFGKFQGVLKRREKKVVVSVNDMDANFHMHLDHKGEAYFLKDDFTDDSPLEIEDCAAPSPNDATPSEISVEPHAIEDSKEEEGQDGKADHEKEESEDERGDDLELRFEGRGSSRELLQQSVGGRASAAALELALDSQGQENTSDVVGFPEVLKDGEANSADDLSSSKLENRNYADVCRIDRETETSGTENHTFENKAVDLEGSQGSQKSSASVANAALDGVIGASPSEVRTSDQNPEPNRRSSRKPGQLIHGLLNKAVGLQELSSQGPSTAAFASAALDSLSKVVSETHLSPTSRHRCASTTQVELSEEEEEEDFQVTEGIKANTIDNLSTTYTDNISYVDVSRTETEMETTSGTVIHALLNQAVGIEVSHSSSQSTFLVANAALEVLTAASLPEVATLTDTPVRDRESSNRAGNTIHGWLNKAIGLQDSASSGPASALIAKAILNSLANVLSDCPSTPTSSNGTTEPRVVELLEEDFAAENEVSNGAVNDDTSSLVVETPETAIVPVPPESSSNDRLVFLVGGRQYPWTIAAPVVLGLLAFGQVRIGPARTGLPIAGERPAVVANGEPAPGTLTGTSSGGWRLWPFGRSARTSAQVNASALLSGDTNALMLATDAAISSRLTKEYMRRNGYYQKPRIVRTNSPSSQQLASLGLKEGSNKITFTFFTRVLGKQQVDARIYLWKWNARIVISDVDGTITKSDVLGQFMPLVGKDWTQSGVAKLFSAIKKNGYELMFLSARAISQAYITRHFLEGIKQDGQQLPDGPVVISPDGLFPSLYREVIRRAPHEFKIACLEDIKSLFPPESKPFYAGFGNRDTDELSYLKVGISKGKIFIINPKGEVMVNNQVDVKSYTSLHTLVDDMFPAMTFTEQEDFNEWNFWKLPLPEIEDDESVKR